VRRGRYPRYSARARCGWKFFLLGFSRAGCARPAGATKWRAVARTALNKINANDIRVQTEPHARGSILVAAVFDAYFTVYTRIGLRWIEPGLDQNRGVIEINRLVVGSARPIVSRTASRLPIGLRASASYSAEIVINCRAAARH